jgi:hypothetical protein
MVKDVTEPPLMQRHIIVYFAPYDLDRDTRYDLTGHDAGRLVAAAKKLCEQHAYVPVAAVPHDTRVGVEFSLDYAYRMMQNGVFSDSWTLEPPHGLKPLLDPIEVDGVGAYGHRSAMMGDLFEIGGQRYVVAAIGFLKLD